MKYNIARVGNLLNIKGAKKNLENFEGARIFSIQSQQYSLTCFVEVITRNLLINVELVRLLYRMVWHGKIVYACALPPKF